MARSPLLPQAKPPRWRRRGLRGAGLLIAALVVAGLLVFALSRLNLHRIGHALVTASPGWIALGPFLTRIS